MKTDILTFFQARLANQLISQGRPYDLVDAVLSTDARDLVKAIKKIEALETLRADAGFEPLASAFKRIGNIIKDFPGGSIDPGLFENEAEKNLYNIYGEIKAEAALLIERGDYFAGLEEIARLREPVDIFFDAVLVMAEDEKVRFNRLSLLAAICSMFRQIADFAKIVTPQ